MPKPIPSGPLYCPELGRSLPLDLSVPQAAALVGVAERTAYRAVRSGEWSNLCIRITGGDTRVAVATLLKLYGLTVGHAE